MRTAASVPELASGRVSTRAWPGCRLPHCVVRAGDDFVTIAVRSVSRVRSRAHFWKAATILRKAIQSRSWFASHLFKNIRALPPLFFVTFPGLEIPSV